MTLVGSSPEPMVQLLDGEVISRPIAGTRYRGATDEEDRRLGAELREHPKEIAEHVMLVDLARNDVGRVVEFGTEKVTEMMTLERYSHVMHLTSQVVGQLRRPRAIDVERPPGRHRVGGAQGAGHGDHRRPRA
ncbi:MAG: chorismate-binding protein [Acidimicrobiales bacterium]